jgi:hypothetical protein
MTRRSRRSKRELADAVEDLEREFEQAIEQLHRDPTRDPLPPETKEWLRESFDIDTEEMYGGSSPDELEELQEMVDEWF